MLIDALFNYISEENTDYALMLTGDWGSGKSHFITYEFKDALKNKFKETKIVNISLNGLQNLEEIYPKILAEVISYSGKRGRITFGLAKILLDLDIEIPKIGLKSKTIANVLKNSSLLVSKETSFPDIILCFDDLERISKNLFIESVLGFIHSNFIEKKKMKVILICDESKITSKDYKEIKEKVVARTYLFKSDIKSLLPKLAASVSSDKEFLNAFKNEHATLINFFEKHEVKNLRTIKFILNILKMVITQKSDIPERILHKITYFILTYSNEYKLGSFSNESKPKLSDFNEIFLIKSFDRNKANQGENEKSYVERFYEKYVNLYDSDFIYVDSIANLILEGFLDAERLSTELSPYYPNSNHITALEKIVHFRDLTESEFQDSVNDVLKYIDNGDYSIRQFLQATLLILTFQENELLIKDPISSINKSKEILLGKIKNESFTSFDLMDRFGIYTGQDNPETLRKITLEFKDAIMQNLKSNLELKIEKFFQLLFFGDEIEAFKEYDKIRYENSLMTLIPTEHINSLLFKSSNRGLHLFNKFLQIRYIHYTNINELYFSEKSAFESIMKYLQDDKNLERSRLRKFLLYEILTQIEIILSKLQ
ncbi:KAP family P-loop domain protein [Leptospira interrogans]|uniref:KAP family P-loop domain protein n=1 Tax=Leptospira interrogans TaxID=173 RepID=UPI0002BD7152|nr:KAP family P-loop domain protein [Leptospira interrogans]EMO92295.1 KAP family P-loop domain protein [Leptospira interrogans str. UI 13372]